MHGEDGCQCRAPFHIDKVDGDRPFEICRGRNNIGTRYTGKHAHNILKFYVVEGDTDEFFAAFTEASGGFGAGRCIFESEHLGCEFFRADEFAGTFFLWNGFGFCFWSQIIIKCRERRFVCSGVCQRFNFGHNGCQILIVVLLRDCRVWQHKRYCYCEYENETKPRSESSHLGPPILDVCRLRTLCLINRIHTLYFLFRVYHSGCTDATDIEIKFHYGIGTSLIPTSLSGMGFADILLYDSPCLVILVITHL